MKLTYKKLYRLLCLQIFFLWNIFPLNYIDQVDDLLYRSVYMPQKSEKKTAVVLVHHDAPHWGGMESHMVNYYKTLLKHGHSVVLITKTGTETARQLDCMKLPFMPFSKNGLYQDMLDACRAIDANVIVCLSFEKVGVAKLVAKTMPIKIIYEQHMVSYAQQSGSVTMLKGIDAVVAVNQELVNHFEKINQHDTLDIKHIKFIPPFMDEDRFSLPLPKISKDKYFKKNFNIGLKQCPTLCMIAGMYPSVDGKNHPLLFKAIHHFVHIKKRPVQALLVGDGAAKEYLKKLVHKLKINEYIHFLGFTPPSQIPAILHYADFHVLASTKESFGLVHIEAGFMKKPSIGALGTGATTIIKHGVSGLLFKNNNLKSLINCIDQLAHRPVLCAKFGKNAFEYMHKYFSNDIHYQLLTDLYKKIGC